MKLFRRIFALTMVIAMVCLFSASALAANHDYEVWQEFGDADGCYAYAFADIEQYQTSGTIEMSEVLLNRYIYLKLDHSYIDKEYPYSVVNPRTAERETYVDSYLSVSKVYNGTIISRMVSATYTFNAMLTNLTGQEIPFNAGPATIGYNGIG